MCGRDRCFNATPSANGGPKMWSSVNCRSTGTDKKKVTTHEDVKRSIRKSSRSLCGALATRRRYQTSCARHDPPPHRPLSLFST